MRAVLCCCAFTSPNFTSRDKERKFMLEMKRRKTNFGFFSRCSHDKRNIVPHVPNDWLNGALERMNHANEDENAREPMNFMRLIAN